MPISKFHSEIASIDEELLVYRHANSHDKPIVSQRVQWWLFGVCSMALMAYAAWSLHVLIPSLGESTWTSMGRVLWLKLYDKDIGWPLLLLKPALLVSLLAFHLLWNRNLRLYVSEKGLRQEHLLPMGLHRLFGRNWSLSWSEISHISTRPCRSGVYAANPLTFAEIVLRSDQGILRVLRPAFWFRPEDPPRRRIRPTPAGNTPFKFLSSDPWVGTENQARLAQAFADLRLTQVLHQFAPAPGIKLPWPGVNPGQGENLNRQPEVLALLRGAMIVFLAGFALMSSAPTIHMHVSPSWKDRALWSLGTWALWAVVLKWWRSKRTSHPPTPCANALGQRVHLSKAAFAFASVLWIAAAAFATEPLLAHVARLGRAEHQQTYRFAVGDGWAQPLGQGAAKVPPIELPDNSRLAWIKKGSEVELTTVEGLFGVWVYDDLPLRNLADAQAFR